MNRFIIETDRLKLRFLNEKDAEDLLLLFNDPHAMQYFPSTKNHAQTLEWIFKNLDSYRKHGFGLYAIIRKEDDRFIGYCGFIFQENVNGKDETEIGYGLIRRYWHNGYAAEAAIACKKYGFDKLNFNRLISLIRPENRASINVARRNGMRWETDIIRWDLLHGVYFVEKSD